MHRSKIRDGIESKLIDMDIVYIEEPVDMAVISCMGTHDDIGSVLHMLYTHNYNDVAKVVVGDDDIGMDNNMFFDIIITA